MNYHLRTNKKKKNIFWWFLLIVAVIFFYPKIIGFFGTFFRAVAYPVWEEKAQIEENSINILGLFTSKKNLIASNEQLQKDLQEAQQMVADRNLLLKENLELKEIMGRMTNENLLLASVLAKPNTTLYDVAVIDIGRDKGLEKGDLVFASGNVLVGEIAEVHKNSSKVRFYSSPKSETSILVGLYNIEATAFGRGAGNYEITLPREADVQINDPVFTTGINSKVLGNVEEIFSDPKDPFKTILFKSPVNIFELKWLQVQKAE